MTRAIDSGPPTTRFAEQKMSSAMPKNLPSKYLSAEENDNVFSALGPNCWSMGSGMAQLMIAEGNRWSTTMIGVACYVRNYARKIVSVSIVDPGYERRRPSVLTEISIGPAVHFVLLARSFVAFEADSTKYALNFAVEEEAQVFCQNVDLLQTRRQKKKVESNMLAPIRDDDQLTTTAPAMVDAGKTKKKKKEKSSFIDWLLSDGKSKKKKVITREDISTPTNSKHTMHCGADGYFLSKEGELDPAVSELYQHIQKDLEGDGADEWRNKKILEVAIKHLGEEELRKIVQEKARPPAPKIPLPETPEVNPGVVTLTEATDSSRSSSASSFCRGNRQSADFDSPGIPLIHARNSIRVSKENYYRRNTVNAVKKFQDMNRSNGSSLPNRFSPPPMTTYEPPRSRNDIPAPPPARKESLLKQNPVPPPPSQSRKPSHVTPPPSAPPPPFPEASKGKETARRWERTPKETEITSKSAPVKAGPSDPPPPLSPQIVVKAEEQLKPAPVVAGPPAPSLPPPAPPLDLPKTPTTPKSVPSAVASSDRANLMEAIRKGIELNKATVPEKTSPKEETPSRSGNSIMDAISMKLNEMRDKIRPESDSEDEEDDSDDWDES
ncbi:hypothetical protein QR680_013198 [Steinernema hermaphroditum]|uniref:WH1 domain-containing protein n=1 Tax=Steinernema hermaphroditum TaxID=289476 RepID=A0AA39M232_9BILA|nr:hypothetical protein QR680_013198 [Steinernema hermaphroditum]